MRIYKGHEQETFIHVHISRHGETTKKLILTDCDKQKATFFIWELLPDIEVNPFKKGNKLTVKIYSQKGKKKGILNHIYAYGLTTEQVHELITNHLNKKDEPRKVKD